MREQVKQSVKSVLIGLQNVRKNFKFVNIRKLLPNSIYNKKYVK